MSIKKQKMSWSFKDLFGPILQTQMDYKWFNVRKNLNYEKALFLPISKEFNKDILSIKKEFNVPKLSPDKDYHLIMNTEIEFEDSDWLYGKPNLFINQWEERITELLHKYRLPVSFMDWVEWNILYGKPKTYPHYNIETFSEIIKNPQEANRISLTTGEKKLLLEYLRFVIKSTKGKRKSILKKSFIQLEKVINQSKNQRRRSRTLKTSMKTLKVGPLQRNVQEETYTRNKNKLMYEDIIPNIFTIEEEIKIGPKRLNARLRKQKERLLKRHIQPQKIKN